MQYAVLLLSRSTEGGGKGEDRYNYKPSRYATADIVYNEADDGEKQWDCSQWMYILLIRATWRANSLHLSIRRGIWKREVKLSGSTANPINSCILKTCVYLLLGLHLLFHNILAQLTDRD